ncbi:MAG: hemerythrin domain-containing protein [Oligoflexus sp.]|nr:hemerythrin domain-containing protein [Oligoflexus sp.]
MQITEREKRDSVGIELADVLYRQQMILQCNEILQFNDEEAVTPEFLNMGIEDEKNLRMIESAVSNFGLRMEPKGSTVMISEALCEVVRDSMALPLEKLSAYVLLKQNQVLCCHIIHKSTQISKPDIKAALAPFEGIYALFTKQLVNLNAHLEQTAVEWITGESPMSGIMGRIRDLAGAAIGTVMSKTAKSSDEMSVLDVLKLDHRKAEMLFKEIRKESNKQEGFAIFNQLKADLTTHSEAEEETVYRRFLQHPDMKRHLDDAWREHVKIRAMLDGLTGCRNDHKLFLHQLNDLQKLVDHHVNEEEGEIFDLIKKHADEAELIHLSQDFLRAKQTVQEAISSNGIDSPVSGMMKPLRSRSDHPSPSASV